MFTHYFHCTVVNIHTPKSNGIFVQRIQFPGRPSLSLNAPFILYLSSSFVNYGFKCNCWMFHIACFSSFVSFIYRVQLNHLILHVLYLFCHVCQTALHQFTQHFRQSKRLKMLFSTKHWYLIHWFIDRKMAI